MRTTVEIPDRLIVRLLEVAARRGERNLSLLIEEALYQFLDREHARADRVEAALGTLGTLSESEVEPLESVITQRRKSWR